ncbi:uncharacterized protein LOC131621559 [Vicia villosa]|uniref:uncharacterized protein LOC131621559 n=1 Tax=Vicia villosa TaxID=3911 RepID=UPI00273BF46F|nr:uncharacterized protein LOC131621559 [Vicia villosa]
MSRPSHFNFSKSSSSSLALTSTKMKKHIHTLIVSSMCRIIRALSKVKSTLVNTLRDKNSNINFPYPSNKEHFNKRKKFIMGSFRLHYNWSSRSNSHVMPVPSRVYEGLPKALTLGQQTQSHDYCHDSELAGYLQWLEESNDIDGDGNKGNEKDEGIIKDVDRLAEMFIANCHEKFKVEMEESCRRHQEMLARSL